jgi:hypothetical protein
MSMKLCICDVDGVLCDTTARFSRALDAKTAVFQQHIAESDPETVKTIARQVESEFWRVAFTPGLLELDKPLAGVERAMNEIELAGYSIVLLSSRIESLREASLSWFWTHQLEVYDRVSNGTLFLKPPAFQHTETTVWKAGIAQMLAAFYGAESVLFVDDEESNRAAFMDQSTWRALKVAASLEDAVKLLYPGREEKQG